MLLKKISKIAFIKTSKLTNQHEIASYIADDFEMIGKMIILNDKNDFIQRLYNMYQSGKLVISDI